MQKLIRILTPALVLCVLVGISGYVFSAKSAKAVIDEPKWEAARVCIAQCDGDLVYAQSAADDRERLWCLCPDGRSPFRVK